MKKHNIIPRKIKGFRDISPELNKIKWHIIDKAKEIYELYGFEHYDTPTLEYAECLGKYLPDEDEVSEGIYAFKNPEEEPLLDEKGKPLRDENNNVPTTNFPVSLRYDLTAPLARFYAEKHWQRYLQKNISSKNAPLIKRYQFGPVFRFERKIDPGRYREFWQIDFDTVGTSSIYADAEAAIILYEAIKNIGLNPGQFKIMVNHRKILSGIIANYLQNISGELEQAILRVLDKYDKIGIKGVIAELSEGRKDNSGAFIKGLNLDNNFIEKIHEFLTLFENSAARENILSQLENLKINNELFTQGLEDLKQIDDILKQSGYSSENITFSPTLVRGMGYYTGTVFEAVSSIKYKDAKGKLRSVGSIAGGGRYDSLVERLLKVKIPAVGASIGIDRLADILLQQDIVPITKKLVVILNLGYMEIYQKLANELRKHKINTEIYYGNETKLRKQLQYADKKQATYAVIIGENEVEQNIALIKDLRKGKELANIKDKKQWQQQIQKEIPLEKVANYIIENMK